MNVMNNFPASDSLEYAVAIVKFGVPIEVIERMFSQGMTDQIYSGIVNVDNGKQFAICYNSTTANRLAVHTYKSGDYSRFSLTAIDEDFRHYILQSVDYNMTIGEALSSESSNPILVIEVEGYHWVIDGWHRLIKSLLLGASEVRTYTLSDAERMECEVYCIELKDDFDCGMTDQEIAEKLRNIAYQSVVSSGDPRLLALIRQATR